MGILSGQSWIAWVGAKLLGCGLIFGSFPQELMATHGEVSLSPLVEFSISNEIPFLVEYSFVLKHRAKYFPISYDDAIEAFQKAMTKGQEIADRADRAPIRELYETYHHLYDIFQFLGKLNWNHQIETNIGELRQLLYRLGEWIYLKENREEQRRGVRVSYLALGIGQPAFHNDAVRELLAMKSQMPRQFRSSMHLLSIYHLYGSESTVANARRYIQRFQKELGRYERKVLALIQARYEAGIIANERVGAAKPNLGQSLLSLSETIRRSRYEGVRNRIDGTILDTWVKVQPNIDWRRVPLSDVANRSQKMPAGLVERMVLEDVREGHILRGLQVYSRLSEEFAGQPVLAHIDLRRSRLAKQHAERSGQHEVAMRTFNELLQKYGPENEQQSLKTRMARQVYVSLFRDYEGYLRELLKRAQSKEATMNMRQLAISGAQNFVQRFARQRGAIRPVMEELGNLMDLLGRPKEAVQIFMDLARDDPGRYKPMAIESQKKAARWPSKPPWGEIPAEARQERIALAKMIEEFTHSDVASQLDWDSIAHLGLLHRALGQPGRAEELWREYLPRAMAGDASQGALGLMMMDYFQRNQWSELIELFQLVDRRQLSVSINNRPINPEVFYQNARLKRAQVQAEQEKWREALVDLQAFADRFVEDRRRPMVLYQMTQLHRKSDQLELAIAQIRTMIKDYPQMPVTKRAVLEGAHWAQTAAGPFASEAASLYQHYVETYPDDQLMPRARFQLAQVQLSLNANREASRHFRAHSRDERVGGVERLRAALSHVRLEADGGGLEQALVEMEPVLRAADRSSPADYVSAQILLAKIALNRQDVQRMSQIEAVLIPYASDRPDAAEAIGMLRFSRVEGRQFEIPFAQSMQSADTYRGSLDHIYKHFQEIARAYDQVCQEGDNTFCYRAYERNRQFAQDAMDAVGSLVVSHEADAEILDELRKQQRNHIDKLKESFDYYRTKANKYENFRPPEAPIEFVSAN